MSDIEKYTYENEYQNDYDYEGSEEHQEGFDLYCDEEQEGCESSVPSQISEFQKRKFEDSNPRFASMAKCFKTQEHCDDEIDETLAQNITDLFRNGIDDDPYSEVLN